MKLISSWGSGTYWCGALTGYKAPAGLALLALDRRDLMLVILGHSDRPTPRTQLGDICIYKCTYHYRKIRNKFGFQ